MSMHINLSPEMESYIKTKVGSGFYGNATEVIRDAIRRMQAEEERRGALRAAVALGEADISCGETVAYTRQEMNAITAEALAEIEDDSPLPPEVCPPGQA